MARKYGGTPPDHWSSVGSHSTTLLGVLIMNWALTAVARTVAAIVARANFIVECREGEERGKGGGGKKVRGVGLDSA